MNRFIPSGSNKIQSKLSSAVVYIRGDLYALGFVGKAEKPAFNYRFESAIARAKYVGEWMQMQDKRAAEKLEAKAVKKAQGRVLAVGDVLCASWGYDQTNIDFYQVVELVGAKSVKVRAIAGDRIENQGDRGQVVPVADQFIGEAFVKRDDQGSISLNSYSSARKMEPVAVLPSGSKIYKSQYWSSYA